MTPEATGEISNKSITEISSRGESMSRSMDASEATGEDGLEATRRAAKVVGRVESSESDGDGALGGALGAL